MPCPSSTAKGCRCSEHELGLAAFAPDLGAYLQALEACKPTSLRALPSIDVKHDPGQQTRGELADVHPWTPRPPRKRAA